MRSVSGFTALLLLLFLLTPIASASPAFPGAKRRTDTSGRWYVAVEALSDRCALVQCAHGAAPLPRLYDSGAGRYGAPGVDPIRRGDRVVRRVRIGGYPVDFLPASDGSGLAAITQDYGPPGYPRGELVTMLSWVPANGPRRSFVLPKPGRPAVIPVGYTTPWRVERIVTDAGLVVISSGHSQPWTVLRVGDGAVRTVSAHVASAKLVPKQLFKTPVRKPWKTRTTDANERKTRLLIAIRGEGPRRPTALERAALVRRAYALLEGEASAVLLALLNDKPLNVTHPDLNVRRAALWVLRHRPEGVAYATKIAFDRKASEGLRVAGLRVLADSPTKERRQHILKLVGDSKRGVSMAAVGALAEQGWDAGPQFIRLLHDSRGHDAAIARYFEAHVVDGSASGLLRALKQSAPNTLLRTSIAKALKTQTLLSGIGEDPALWEQALGASRPSK